MAAWDPRKQECTGCGSCAEEGTTGAIWPTTTEGGRCICETMPGYYFDDAVSALRSTPCDADQDGWVRIGAKPFLQSTDPGLKANARCDLRLVSAFRLVNERGESREVPVADAGASSDTIGLYEPLSLDVADGKDLDPYRQGGQGRAFAPAELNPLTKACASQTGDYNKNALSDLSESGLSPPSEPWMLPFTRMSFFVELHRWAFDPGQDGAGHLVISERRRCGQGFPLVGEGLADNWSTCTRVRPLDYAADADVAGFDLAAWNCDESQGSCPPPEPLSLATEQPDATQAAPHPYCVDPPPPITGAWSGMNHHSQFQCADFVTLTPGAALEPFQREIGDSTSYLKNSCWLAAPGEDGQPVVTCQAEVTPNPGVGWSLARYDDREPEGCAAGQPCYRRGCIQECDAYLPLCPGYDADPDVNGAGCDSDETSGTLACNKCPRNTQGCSESGDVGVCASATYDCELGNPADGSDDVEVCKVDVQGERLLKEVAKQDGMPDPPGGPDDDCDRFHGDLETAIFVDLGVLGDGGSGTMSEPFGPAKLKEALEAAPEGSVVYLTEGAWEGPPLTLPVGVSLVGGQENALGQWTQGSKRSELRLDRAQATYPEATLLTVHLSPSEVKPVLLRGLELVVEDVPPDELPTKWSPWPVDAADQLLPGPNGWNTTGVRVLGGEACADQICLRVENCKVDVGTAGPGWSGSAEPAKGGKSGQHGRRPCSPAACGTVDGIDECETQYLGDCTDQTVNVTTFGLCQEELDDCTCDVVNAIRCYPGCDGTNCGAPLCTASQCASCSQSSHGSGGTWQSCNNFWVTGSTFSNLSTGGRAHYDHPNPAHELVKEAQTGFGGTSWGDGTIYPPPELNNGAALGAPGGPGTPGEPGEPGAAWGQAVFTAGDLRYQPKGGAAGGTGTGGSGGGGGASGNAGSLDAAQIKCESVNGNYPLNALPWADGGVCTYTYAGGDQFACMESNGHASGWLFSKYEVAADLQSVSGGTGGGGGGGGCPGVGSPPAGHGGAALGVVSATRGVALLNTEIAVKSGGVGGDAVIGQRGGLGGTAGLGGGTADVTNQDLPLYAKQYLNDVTSKFAVQPGTGTTGGAGGAGGWGGHGSPGIGGPAACVLLWDTSGTFDEDWAVLGSGSTCAFAGAGANGLPAGTEPVDAWGTALDKPEWKSQEMSSPAPDASKISGAVVRLLATSGDLDWSPKPDNVEVQGAE